MLEIWTEILRNSSQFSIFLILIIFSKYNSKTWIEFFRKFLSMSKIFFQNIYRIFFQSIYRIFFQNSWRIFFQNIWRIIFQNIYRIFFKINETFIEYFQKFSASFFTVFFSYTIGEESNRTDEIFRNSAIYTKLTELFITIFFHIYSYNKIIWNYEKFFKKNLKNWKKLCAKHYKILEKFWKKFDDTLK